MRQPEKIKIVFGGRAAVDVMLAVVGDAAHGGQVAAGEHTSAITQGEVEPSLGGGEPVGDTEVEDVGLGAEDGGG